MKYLVLVVLLLFSFVAKAQTDCGPAYDRILNEADNDLKQGLFKKAFEGYRAARGCTKAKLDYIDQQMSAALDSIERQRLKSVAREELLQQTLKEIKATNSKLNKTQGDLVKALKDAEAARDSAEQAEARALKLAQENERNLIELRTTYKEKIESLLRQAELQISRLRYDSVLLTVNNIHNFPGGKEKTSDLLFECAFFYGESEQLEKAREVFSLLGEKMSLDRKTIANYLKSQNSVQYDSLMKLYYPSFQRFNGGYFLSSFWDRKEREKTKAGLIIYKPSYKLVNTLTANTSYITNRQFYLFKPTKNIVNTISSINQEKSFSSPKECASYLNWLSAQFNKIPFYSIKDSTISQKNDTFFISVVKNSNGFRLANKDEWEFLFKMNLGQIASLKMESTMKDINLLLQNSLKYWINVNTHSISNSKSEEIWVHDFGSKNLSSIQLVYPNSYNKFIDMFGSMCIISNDY